MTATDRTAEPDAVFDAHLAVWEAADWAEESIVERVARAIYEEANPAEDPWCEAWGETGDFAAQRYRRLAVAALTALRGPVADDETGAVERVRALIADDIDTPHECTPLIAPIEIARALAGDQP